MGKLVWIDLEMTGLDPIEHKVIELACVITDDSKDLNIIGEPLSIQINVADEELAKMDEWNVKHHRESGLIEKVKESPINAAMAEEIVLQYLIDNGVEEKQSPLCGNSVHMDSAFMMLQMPKLRNYIHYRIIDISSIKELAKRWYPEIPKFIKKETHVAIDDIKESIQELKYFKSKLLI